MQETIIERIKKLMSLASNNSSEEEAQLAMSNVQRLMVEHNLEMSNIEAHRSYKGVTEPDEVVRQREQLRRIGVYDYQRILWRNIAELNMCWYMSFQNPKVGTRDSFKHVVVGRDFNVMSTTVMGDYLETVINRLCPYPTAGKMMLSWKEGISYRIAQRLRERFEKLNDESQMKSSDSLSLTLTEVKQAEYDANYKFLYGDIAYRDMVRCREESKLVVKEAPVEREETEQERIKREKENARWQRKSDAERRRYWNKRDMGAFYSGQDAGDTVNLDTQVKEGVRLR